MKAVLHSKPKIIVRFKGGPGSGHFGHSGRPGKVGGSGGGLGAAWKAGKRVYTSDLPLSMGADWRDLNNPMAREFFIERATTMGKNIDNQIGRAQLDKMYELANDDAYRLPEDKVVYFGLRGQQFSNMVVGDEISALGTRSTASTADRASKYSGGNEGGVFEVQLRKGDLAIPARVMDIDETVLLPGSKFRIVGKRDDVYITELVSDGVDYINELTSFRNNIDDIVAKR